MKRILITATIALIPAVGMAGDIGVSLTVDKGDVYGSINIGGMPRPQTVNARPVIVEPASGAVAPMYLHVPHGQAKKWSRYCGQYNACGRPVYFVRDDWYDNTYVPRERERRNGGHQGGEGQGHGNHGGRGHH